MTPIDKETALKVAARVRREGLDLKENAAYGGEHGDGGGGALIAQADAFEAGLRGGIPNSWDHYLAAVRREEDPEYATYLKLQAKFGK
jgi:hypothetical protein